MKKRSQEKCSERECSWFIPVEELIVVVISSVLISFAFAVEIVGRSVSKSITESSVVDIVSVLKFRFSSTVLFSFLSKIGPTK